MTITGYITAKSTACTLADDFSVSEYMLDIGFTFVNEGFILNNRISLSCSEVPDGVMLAIDPYGRIICKFNSTADSDSVIKLKIETIDEESYECIITFGTLFNSVVGDDLVFTEIQDEGGEGGE